MNISIEQKKLFALMNIFYSDYFERYLYEMINGNPEKSVVTLFKGMNFYISLQKELNIKSDFQTIEEFLIKEFEDGKKIYSKLLDDYNEEIKIYTDKEKNFEEIFGEL